MYIYTIIYIKYICIGIYMLMETKNNVNDIE